MASNQSDTTKAADTSKGSGNEFVVLCGVLTARLDAEGKKVERFVRGSVVKLNGEIQNLEHLQAIGAIAPKADVESGKARQLTALSMSQRAAQYEGENSPVLDLSVQPRAVTGNDQTDEATPAQNEAQKANANA